MADYKIADTTLTSIGDAIRNKTGKLTRIETVIETIEGITKISKTPNATGFDSWEGTYGNESLTDVVTIPNASSLRVKMAYQTANSTYANVRVKEGVHDNISTGTKYGGTTLQTVELTFPNTDTVTFYFFNAREGDYLGYYAEIVGLDENGNLLDGITEVEKEVEVPNTMTPAQMAQAIDDILPGPTDEDLTITGDCSYRFTYNGWNWFINKYVDKIKTRDITISTNMFYYADVLEEIPFELNMIKMSSGNGLGYLFYYCTELKSIPKINNAMAGDMTNIFSGCQSLRTLPEDLEDWFDWSYVDTLTSAYSCPRGYTFNNCYSLRKVPMGFLKHANPVAIYSSSIYYNGFNNCFVLDEIVGLPLPHHNATWTSTAFYNTFNNCKRLKNMTFAVQEDGTPYNMKWKSQTIDLSTIGYVGWNNTTKPVSSWTESERKSAASNIIDYNSGITFDKCIYNDETYALLKDDEDAFCLANYRTGYTDYSYSRYNHDSAVATINSLPDTSAYLATAGGTNTIKFQGAAGSKTDGGAINTLTEEEIAVATAKGWTVTLV